MSRPGDFWRPGLTCVWPEQVTFGEISLAQVPSLGSSEITCSDVNAGDQVGPSPSPTPVLILGRLLRCLEVICGYSTMSGGGHAFCEVAALHPYDQAAPPPQGPIRVDL
eukprot:2254055-Rhodomonas_salina.1